MIYKEHKCGSYNIHTIKTDKFKNIRMEIIFRNNIDKETIQARTVLFEMLMESSEDYKTRRDLVLELESLYNASVYSSSNKVGNIVSTSVVMDFLNPKYTEEDYLEDAIKLPFDLIFKPNVLNEEFDSNVLNTIKTRLISDIKSVNEIPSKYTIKNALKEFAPSTVTSLSINGEEDTMSLITPSSLYKLYKEVLIHDYIDIYIIGDIDTDRVVDIISKYAIFNTIKNHEINIFVDNKMRSKINKVVDKSNYSQSHIVYLYNIDSLTPHERKYAFNVYNAILGGGSLESKLSQKLRGDNSLCYGIQSVYHKYDNLMFIYTSVDNKNINKAKKLIEETVDDLIDNLTEEDIEMEKSLIISSITLSIDNPVSIISQYYFHNIAELDLIDDRIKEYSNITLKDVKNMCKKIKLNTIYVLEGEDNGED